jgi:hypothetical protein
MSGPKRTRVPLFGLTDDQQERILRIATRWLISMADDLPPYGPDNLERAIGDLAALGRLTSMLRHEVVGIPDAQVKALIETRVGETRHLDELTEEYERERHEHEAWVALLAHFPDAEVITDD